MANYFVINNKFRPYSFDELIKPYQIYGQAYKEQEALLDAAREKEFSPDYLDQKLDSAAYNMYNQATQNLQAASDELATKGLSAGLRGRIRTTARDYQRTMGALTEAQQRLYAERERRAKLGEDYVYQQDNLRIGDFLNGNSPKQDGVSLSKIEKDIATDFARAKSITTDSWDRVINAAGRNIPGYYDVTTSAGLTAAKIDSVLNSTDSEWQEIMKDKNISDPEKETLQRLRGSVQAKKKAIGYDSFDNANYQFKIDDAIARGAGAALLTTEHNYKKDEAYVNPVTKGQYEIAQERWREEKKLKRVALEVKYPQFQFDEDGNLKRDADGNPTVTAGWKQVGNKWIGPNGQTSEGSSSAKTRTPYFGVKFYRKNGEVRSYKDVTEWNKKSYPVKSVTDVTQLSDKNIQRLALDLNLTGNVTAEEVFAEAVRRGVTIGVIDKGINKDTNRPDDEQEMLLVDAKTQIGANEAAQGTSSTTTYDASFDPDAVAEEEEE